MPTPLLTTKLYIPPPRRDALARPHLIDRLNLGLGSNCRITVISASAGFGKTTLASQWADGCGRPAAWVSLDEGDSDPVRFLTYVVAAIRTVAPIDEELVAALQSPRPPSAESIMIEVLNEIAEIQVSMMLVLDDYHLIDARPVDDAITHLFDYLPPGLHLVIVSREDPHLPLARWRARGMLAEMRANDLRFSPAESDGFLAGAMGLRLSPEDVNKLQSRTEGWIAGLQLAALSLQGQPDPAVFIKAFGGSDRFVLDYLLEEVLRNQSQEIQDFLVATSIADRLCGSLCDAILDDFGTKPPSFTGQETLEFLDRSNLFIVPLDKQRQWYRYHHLFADLLRLRQPTADKSARLHLQASQWFEENGLELEAFHHATKANDLERAERLIESKGMPLHLRGTVSLILDWISSLPPAVLESRPSLLVRFATLSLIAGLTTGLEAKFHQAETALRRLEPSVTNRQLLGQIAAARATISLSQYQTKIVIVQAEIALAYLPATDLTYRFTAVWAKATAHYLAGNRQEAAKSYEDALVIARLSGDVFSTILAVDGKGQLQELNNQLCSAAESYREVLELFGDHPQPNGCEAHLGLARIFYQWNDLDAALLHGQQSLKLARQYDKTIDRYILSLFFLARLKLAQGNIAAASAILSEANQSIHQQNFMHRLPELAAIQTQVFLKQGNLHAAASLCDQHPLAVCQSRVHLAKGEAREAMALLGTALQAMESKSWRDECLRILILQALAHQDLGEEAEALRALNAALSMAEPGGFIRVFVDEGPPMARLLSMARAKGLYPDYTTKLLQAFATEESKKPLEVTAQQSLPDPLSNRELEILQLIAQGLSNNQIGERLFLSPSTIKWHNQLIFDKLQVQRRTEAVARARSLSLLPE